MAFAEHKAAIFAATNLLEVIVENQIGGPALVFFDKLLTPETAEAPTVQTPMDQRNQPPSFNDRLHDAAQNGRIGDFGRGFGEKFSHLA